jgi:hypothetical protein
LVAVPLQIASFRQEGVTRQRGRQYMSESGGAPARSPLSSPIALDRIAFIHVHDEDPGKSSASDFSDSSSADRSVSAAAFFSSLRCLFSSFFFFFSSSLRRFSYE